MKSKPSIVHKKTSDKVNESFDAWFDKNNTSEQVYFKMFLNNWDTYDLLEFVKTDQMKEEFKKFKASVMANGFKAQTGKSISKDYVLKLIE